MYIKKLYGSILRKVQLHKMRSSILSIILHIKVIK